MTEDEAEFWFDRDPGPLVRPFALTGGRASSQHLWLDMITLVTTVRADGEALVANRESAEILRMCHHRPLSVAEVAARLDVLLAVAKVLIGDLIDAGLLASHSTPSTTAAEPDMNLLQAVLDGVRRL